MDFARESFSDSIAKELFPLNQAHNDEVSIFKDIPLDPDYIQYKRFQDSGCLRVYTARQDGVLVGYGFYFVTWAPHHRGSVQASQDMLYMVPEVRKGFNGAKFIRWIDDALRYEQVQVVYSSTTWTGKDFGPVLERIGYRPIENLYARRLDQWEAE